MEHYDIKEAGPAPLINAMCDAIQLTEIVNANTFGDEKQCKLSPGILLNLLTLMLYLFQHKKNEGRLCRPHSYLSSFLTMRIAASGQTISQVLQAIHLSWSLVHTDGVP